MRNLIQIFEKVQDTTDIFDLAIAGLKAALEPSMTYDTAKFEATKVLQGIAAKHAVPEHPVKVLMDFYTHDGSRGRFSSHKGEGWLIVNMLNMVEDDWTIKTSENELENVIFRVAQTFANEMMHYEQYCRNWERNENRLGGAPYQDRVGEIKALASSAARELLRHYKTVSAVLEALRTNTRGVALASQEMRSFLRGERDPADLRRFLGDLYGQLDLLRTRGK